MIKVGSMDMGDRGSNAGNIQGQLHTPTYLGNGRQQYPRKRKTKPWPRDQNVGKVNPYHTPAGSPEGGEFTSGGSGGGNKGKSSDVGVLYHGTLDLALSDIRKNGLVPGKGKGGDNSLYMSGAIEAKDVPKHQTKVFLSNDATKAFLYAHTAKEGIVGSIHSSGSDPGAKVEPVLLKIRIPEDVLHQLKEDKQDPDEGSFTFKGTIPPEWIEAYAVTPGDNPAYYTPGKPGEKAGISPWKGFKFQQFKKSVSGKLIYASFLVKQEKVSKALSKTLYVSRPVLNTDAIIAWAKTQGFQTALQPDDLHVTIAFSRMSVDWTKLTQLENTVTVPAVAAYESKRFITRLGETGDAAVLQFESDDLGRRWRQIKDAGASWDWPTYQPHITISWNAPAGIEAKAQPYLGEIVLGPEVFAEVKEDWKDSVVEKISWKDQIMQKLNGFGKVLGADATAADYIDDFVNSDDPKFKDKSKEERIKQALAAWYSNKSLAGKNLDAEVAEWMQKIGARHSRADQQKLQEMHDHACALGAQCKSGHEIVETGDSDYRKVKIVKVDSSLGLVLGFGIICKIDGQPYYDLNRDADGTSVPEHIPEDAMLKSSLDFMQHSRLGNEMHEGPDKGQYVFAFPLTEEIAKAMGLQTKMTGLMVGYAPPPDVLAKFIDGTYTGFSIQGRRVLIEEHE